MLINCKYCVEKSRTLMLTAYENTFYFALFYIFFSIGHRFNCRNCTGNMCNNSFTSGCHFSTWEINTHFRIPFTAKFKFLKLHSKVHSLNECSNSTKFVWALSHTYTQHTYTQHTYTHTHTHTHAHTHEHTQIYIP